MLQCEWPKVWSMESREAVRVAIETAIRKAMAGSTNKQIRGVVNVDLPTLGSAPPELVLSGIRELSLERTALMVKLRYNGDFSVTLRGLQINLDTIGSSGEDANLALPFYCPFEMTLHDILVDGMASIELFQEMEDCALADAAAAEEEAGGLGSSSALGGAARGSDRHTHAPQPRQAGSSSAANAQLLQAGRAAGGPGRSGGGGPGFSGYGVLLGAGGRRAMRPPEVLGDDLAAAPGGPYSFVSPLQNSVRSSSVVSTSAGPAGLSAAGNPPANTATPASAGPGARPDGASADATRTAPVERASFSDLLSKKVRAKRRTIKIQLFGDPIKNLSVASNFASVPGANSKVEGTIKMLIKPAIDRMMTEGVTIHF